MLDVAFDDAKRQVEFLVRKFNQEVENGRVKSYNEENTKKDFITPLFRALGWDVENIAEVSNEDRVSKGRVDYAFRLSGIPKLFVEAKALNKGLDEAKDADQAINYAWHKGTTWAVLTNFETLAIYNAEVKEKSISDCQFIRLTCDQFVEQFPKLWWISKPAFQQNLLDKEAVAWGKKLRRTKVDEQLLEELMYHRELLSKNILIFIRTAEDRQIEPPTLMPKLRETQEKQNANFMKQLNIVFRFFDKNYNSKLFLPHVCEELEIDNEVLFKVISGLYESKDGLTHYDFSAIDADVLGNIYEQYLSHILKKTEKRAKVESKVAHRKEQGIYYTPIFIVDYIVRNTVGALLATNVKQDIERIRVLDMACGSGSFLIKVFDLLDQYWMQEDKDYSQTKLDVSNETARITRKIRILKNNIYGVDLDPKAVEIAQLNLLLKAAETKYRLPDLRENIKCGNSLIGQSLSEEVRAFNWNKEFPEISSEGGFDVIVGNPPYVQVEQIGKGLKEYYFSQFSFATGRVDLYLLFMERALRLLKPGGIMGFITPSIWTRAKYGSKLREYVSKTFKILSFIDFGDLKVFQDATTYPSIIILKKEIPSTTSEMNYCRIKELPANGFSLQDPDRKFADVYRIPQTKFGSDPWVFKTGAVLEIVDKMEKACESHLRDVRDQIYEGFITGDNAVFFLDKSEVEKFKLEKEYVKPVPKGKKVRRFFIDSGDLFVVYPYDKTSKGQIPFDLAKAPNVRQYLELHSNELRSREYLFRNSSKKWFEYVRPRDKSWFERPKILTPNLSAENNFAVDYGQFGEYLYVDHDCYAITLKSNDMNELFFITALLNSKLAEFFIKQRSPMFSGGYYKYHTQ
jgi:type I restriction-modification system DNA methylase subunit